MGKKIGIRTAMIYLFAFLLLLVAATLTFIGGLAFLLSLMPISVFFVLAVMAIAFDLSRWLQKRAVSSSEQNAPAHKRAGALPEARG
jgi:hypothetical protein